MVLLALKLCQLQRLIQCHTHLASENLVTMVEKFLGHNKRKLTRSNDSDGNESGKKAVSL